MRPHPGTAGTLGRRDLRSVLAVAVPALAVAMGAGCAERAPRVDQGLTVTTDSVGGRPHVRNSGFAPEWRLEPVLRLGTAAGGPEQFGRIRSLVADGEGNVYVAENFAHEIRVFGPDGTHLRSIGRRGEGPGEFGDLYSLAWLGENLVAMDPANARIATFSREGEWLGSTQHFSMRGSESWIRLHPLGVDGFYAPAFDAAGLGLTWVRVAPSAVGDTIPSPSRPSEARSTNAVCPTPDGNVTFISLPEAPQLVFGFPPAGGVVAVGWSDEYRLAFLTPSGDTLRAVTRQRARAAYPDSLWEQGMRPYRELRETFPGVRCDPAVPQRPRYRAALRHLLFDDAGRLWVEAAVQGGFEWEVFDVDGRLLGAALAPPRAPGIPPYVRNGTMYQVETDDMGVQHVGVYRLVEGS